MSDYYRILGLTPEVTAREIKQAYRRLAHRYHPDANPPQRKEWAEAQMRLINEAYEVLGDPDKRAVYDLKLRLRRQRTSVWRERPTWTYQPPPPREAQANEPFRREHTAPPSHPNWVITILFFGPPILIGLLFVAFLVSIWVDPGSVQFLDLLSHPSSPTSHNARLSQSQVPGTFAPPERALKGENAPFRDALKLSGKVPDNLYAEKEKTLSPNYVCQGALCALQAFIWFCRASVVLGRRR